ncbi:McrC family protein [Pseudoduganella ginsengisoli]|uniref:Restriction endonuclease n=1 Tax=Pseudoduganella ginsengisoli TaxID=1462440 RepID=A0A6L6QA23_9BURK|nr:McrC family protein [Pseudoduganella ginsengisoli]MTW06092.1 restriction endonuclease [Pseudoduganella ginsengisoli]
MIRQVTVREYARLTTSVVESPSLDRATVTKSAFDYLCRLAGQFRAGGAQLLEVEGSQWLRLDNFVGIVETPCGTTLEILPKHHDADDCEESARMLLVRMIETALELPVRRAGSADLTLFRAPLSEWVRSQFLLALEHLVKRGMKSDFVRVEEEQRNLRGQLDMVRQLRQLPERGHYFHTRHDVYSLDFPENRLIKAALAVVASSTRNAANWRLSHELLHVLADVPASRMHAQDFKVWRGGRLMAHYAPILPWCQLVLGQRQPLAVQGTWHGISMLFPMEKLFERFVEASVRRLLPVSARLKRQAKERYLCQHNGAGFFRLEPDLLIEHGGERTVLDAKWKRLNASARIKKYGIAQSDFYQLFAYGHQYIAAEQEHKELVLIYPKTAAFDAPLPPFSFAPGMTLWVLPFELGAKVNEERLIVAPEMRLAQVVANAKRIDDRAST